MEVDMTSEPPEGIEQGEDLEADTEVEDTMNNGLKRSCSAPLINQLIAQEDEARQSAGRTQGSHTVLHGVGGVLQGAAQRLKPAGSGSGSGSYLPAGLGGSRWRRWSTSTSTLGGPPPTGGCGTGVGSQLQPNTPNCHLMGGAGWARLNRIKVEETKDVSKLEIQTEREVQRGLNIENNLSQSWEDLSLSDAPKESRASERGRGSGSGRGQTDPMQPLTIGVGPFPSPRTSPSPSPSPTRSSVMPGKQCFSPSMGMAVPNLSFSPSPSSSPTRRGWTSRRSLSPITLRPSPLGPVKRKCMLDDAAELGATPSKRHSSLLSITHQNSYRERAAPYRLPLHVSQGWATPSSSPSHSLGPSSDHSGCSRESSPSPAGCPIGSPSIGSPSIGCLGSPGCGAAFPPSPLPAFPGPGSPGSGGGGLPLPPGAGAQCPTLMDITTGSGSTETSL